ncbi:MAG TPA: hypothetical protein VMY78_04120 [Solirubrobacteraceae bacterium]|nr:hypothetical protein [Solirubrobacteraceae bacterium]
MNALSEYLREQAAAHRATAAERPEDARYVRGAEALEALADYAQDGADQGLYQMRYLLEHHVVDGRFAWPEGQSGRAIRNFGFDRPVAGEADLEHFLMDLCDVAKSDASRHIGEHHEAFHRGDATLIARRYGLSVERVHHSLDTGRRYRQLFVVGIPAEHPVDAGTRARLEAIDGVIVAPGTKQAYGDAPPLLVKNVPAADDEEARAHVGNIVGIEPAALGAAASARVP